MLVVSVSVSVSMVVWFGVVYCSVVVGRRTLHELYGDVVRG